MLQLVCSYTKQVKKITKIKVKQEKNTTEKNLGNTWMGGQKVRSSGDLAILMSK